MKKQRLKLIAASYLFLIKDNKILLLRRFNTWYSDGNYSVIAWHLEQGESFYSCIIRESKEEWNIIIQKKDLNVVHIMQRNIENNEENWRIDVFFYCDKREWELKNNEIDKCDDLSWFDIENLPNNIIPYIKKSINYFKDNNFYSESWF